MGSPCEMPRVYDETFRKARKQHVCCECSNEINVGVKYVVCEGLWDGKWQVYRLCLRCWIAHGTAHVMHRGYPEEGPAFDYLWEWLFEEHDARGFLEEAELCNQIMESTFQRRGNRREQKRGVL